MKKIWIASHNQHKITELTNLLQPRGIAVHTPAELVGFTEVNETGTTFAENALLKAKTLFAIVKEPVIADDSGLLVPALDGAPGVYSARFAGLHATDSENCQKLLTQLQNKNNRQAYFITLLVLITANEDISYFEGKVAGEITHTPRGKSGFGYDPLFYAHELNKTFAEATLAEKNQVSHRAKALENLLKHRYFQV